MNTREAYIACHKSDALWMIGEPVQFAKHAFRTSGYDLADVARYAAGQGLAVLRIDQGGILQPVKYEGNQ